MKIDGKLISYLEDLSQLSLSAGERTRIAVDLEKALGYIQVLSKLDTAGAAELTHPFDNVNALREDAVLPGIDRAQLLGLAPNSNKEYIIAPKTVD